MRVSVVMPAYQAAATIDRALQSVADQTLAPDEIIVVDDGSTDTTASKLARWSPMARVVRTPNGGPARARNVGIARATGDLVAFVDADDTWSPEALERRVEAFRRHPGLHAAAGAWQWQTGLQAALPLANDEWERPLRPAGEGIFRCAYAMTASTVVVRRDLLSRRPFDESLLTAEDRDLWIRLAAGGPVWFSRDVIAEVLCRPESISQQDAARDCRNMLTVVERHSQLLTPAARRRLEAGLYRQWAGRLLAEGRAADAWQPARARLTRAPWSVEGWWIVAKCAARRARAAR